MESGALGLGALAPGYPCTSITHPCKFGDLGSFAQRLLPNRSNALRSSS